MDIVNQREEPDEAGAGSLQAVIFTTPSCVYCKMTKEFFRKNNIAYEERDVAADQAAREEMVKKSGDRKSVV